MTYLEAIILGIIQGLTEFLPVSSSGHIELGKALLGVQLQDDLLFSVVVHAATALSTLWVFRQEIGELVRETLRLQWNQHTQYAAKIILSMFPVGIVGLAFKDTIEGFFEGNILLVGAMLCLTACLLAFTHFYKPQHTTDVTFPKALSVGIAQAIAILPGISRSGATISTALLVGIDRTKAAKFSFLMVLPPIAGATLLEVKDFMEQTTPSNLTAGVLTAGFIAAMLTGVVACKLMVELVKKSKLIYFAVYCLVVGSIAVVWALK